LPNIVKIGQHLTK